MNVEVKELKQENKKLKQALEEIKKICGEYPHIDDKEAYQAITCDSPITKVYKIKVIVNEVLND